MNWHSGLLLAITVVAAELPDTSAQEKTPAPSRVSWKKTIVDRTFRSEGVAVADVNKDGKPDIIVGDVWYEAPTWKMHSLRKERVKDHRWDPLNYAESFGVFADDFNGDGYPDAIVIPFPGKECFWYENPKGTTELWKEHKLAGSACNESPLFVDLFKTGKRVLVMGWRPDGKPSGGEVCYFQPGKDPAKPWQRYSVSGPSKDGKDVPGSHHFYHGLGHGDVNGDGRIDIIVPDGWWEQPEKQDGQPWTWHPTKIGPNCAHMFTLDVDGDGKVDIVTSSAHGYGLWWHQQKPGNIFLQHEFFPDPPKATRLPKDHGLNADELAVYDALNKLRAEKKRAPWKLNPKLCADARLVSKVSVQDKKAANVIGTTTVQSSAHGLERCTRALWFVEFKPADVALGLYPDKEVKSLFQAPRVEVGISFARGEQGQIVCVLVMEDRARFDNSSFSLPGQTHALHMVDINGDGVPDLVTGRRFWAHGPNGDASPADPCYLLWFEAKRGKSGQITFIPHEVDDDSGIGTQFEIADINGDGIPDIIISNKRGVYIFEQVRLPATKD